MYFSEVLGRIDCLSISASGENYTPHFYKLQHQLLLIVWKLVFRVRLVKLILIESFAQTQVGKPLPADEFSETPLWLKYTHEIINIFACGAIINVNSFDSESAFSVYKQMPFVRFLCSLIRVSQI